MPGQLKFQNVNPPQGGGRRLVVQRIKISRGMKDNIPIRVEHAGPRQQRVAPIKGQRRIPRGVLLKPSHIGG